jgi:hypothetical protein
VTLRTPGTNYTTSTPADVKKGATNAKALTQGAGGGDRASEKTAEKPAPADATATQAPTATTATTATTVASMATTAPASSTQPATPAQAATAKDKRAAFLDARSTQDSFKPKTKLEAKPSAAREKSHTKEPFSPKIEPFLQTTAPANRRPQAPAASVVLEKF